MGIQAFEPVLVRRQRHPAAPAGVQGVQRRLRRRPDGRASAAVGGGNRRGEGPLMMPGHNIFSPASGQPIVTPSRTSCSVAIISRQASNVRSQAGVRSQESGVEGRVTAIRNEVIPHTNWDRSDCTSASKYGCSGTWTHPRRRDEAPDWSGTTTVGRVLFNDILPKEMPSTICR